VNTFKATINLKFLRPGQYLQFKAQHHRSVQESQIYMAVCRVQ